MWKDLLLGTPADGVVVAVGTLLLPLSSAIAGFLLCLTPLSIYLMQFGNSEFGLPPPLA